MFKHILVPIDGSDLSKQAMHKAVGMAKEMGAKVTGFHVVPEFRYAYFNEYIPADFIPPEEQEARSKKVATGYLAEVEKACAAADVKCAVHYVVSDFPAEAIVKAIDDYQCDLVAMASHARTGIARVMLGSETQKVLSMTKLPVLVLR